MDQKLDELADEIKNSEYRELFPDTKLEEAKQDEEKVKEALFQVYGFIWNEELYNYCEENSQLTRSEIHEMAEDEQQFERINKGIGAATVSENEAGEVIIPASDVKYALTKRTALWD